MNYFSTNRQAPVADFREAVFKSLPSDNGLYFPEEIPDLSDIPFKGLSLQEIGYEVMKPFVGGALTSEQLLQITYEAFNFEIPAVKVEDAIYSLELFHGPTYAFKDVGARFLARCLGRFTESMDDEITILVATSGDTGGAVASGFYQVPGVNVVILYPSGKVSELQEKQLTTLGGNVTALEVDGTFDDCQHLVKQAFLDEQLNREMNLSSANSINIARWIPQSIYYFWATNQFDTEDLVVSVPSGNYGNLAAGILAKKMGAPIKRFIASCNLNDVVPRYLNSGAYEPHPTIQTYSNAMDVGKPSNFPRILELYGGDFQQIIKEIEGDKVDDSKTLHAIKDCWEQHQYVLDPHGAIGYTLLQDHLKNGETGVFLETAHPCKFLPVVSMAIKDYQVPEFTRSLLAKEKAATKISADYAQVKEFICS
ncbi:MAG: threonine synthase [Bacteroidota bacterium]